MLSRLFVSTAGLFVVLAYTFIFSLSVFANPVYLNLAVRAISGLTDSNVVSDIFEERSTETQSTLPRQASIQHFASSTTLTIQIPVATICPHTVGDSTSINANLALQPFSPITAITETTEIRVTSLVSSSTLPKSTVTTPPSVPSLFLPISYGLRRRKEIAAETEIVLPNGIIALAMPTSQAMDETVTNSTETMAQINLGSDGCETLFTPFVTTVCSATIQLVGLPSVTITDCNQYVTFSSEIGPVCSQTQAIVPVPYMTPTQSVGSFTSPSASVQHNAEGVTRTLVETRRVTVLETTTITMSSSMPATVTTTAELSETRSFNTVLTPSSSHLLASISLSTGASTLLPTTTNQTSPTYTQTSSSSGSASGQAASSAIVSAVFNNSTSSVLLIVSAAPARLKRSSTSFTDQYFQASVTRVRREANKVLLGPPPPTTYLAAHWTAMATAGVPATVEVLVCNGGLPPLGVCLRPDTDGDTEQCECTTTWESWIVSTQTQTRIGTTIASFNGVATYTVGNGGTNTTSISFSSAITTTAIFRVPSVVRSRIPAPTRSQERTITDTVTIADTTSTIHIEAVSNLQGTVTQTSYVATMTETAMASE